MVTLKGTKGKTTAQTHVTREKSGIVATANIKVKKTKRSNASATSRAASVNDIGKTSREAEWEQFLRFFIRSSLFLTNPMEEVAARNATTADTEEVSDKKKETTSYIGSFCDAMIVAQCVSKKEKQLNASQILGKLSQTNRKRVCGAVFGADEIAYSCRSCQVDPTCVICNQCFLNSDHTGHDVHFQRTAAGSSCDCGDSQAWKKDGFCNKHVGVDAKNGSPLDGRIWAEALKFDGTAEKTLTKWNRHLKLPKALCKNAFVVIDAVLDHVHQTLLGIQFAFELAEAFELFSRGMHDKAMVSKLMNTISTPLADEHVLSENAHVDQTVQEQEVPMVSNSKGDSCNVPQRQGSTSFYIRVHNDDLHTYQKVVNTLIRTFNLSESTSTRLVDAIDRHGDAIIGDKYHLVQCTYPVAECAWATLNVSVAPAWLDRHIMQLEYILEWIHRLITCSDGLNVLLTHALCKPRQARLHGVTSMAALPHEDETVPQFLKSLGMRLNDQTHEAMVQIIQERSIQEWASQTTEQMKSHHTFFNSRSDKYNTMALNEGEETVIQSQQLEDKTCNNLYIANFMDHMSRTAGKLLMASDHNICKIREGCEAIIQQYYVKSCDKAPFFSTLELLMRYDPVLRRSTSEKLHQILRELLLCSPTFRDKMLKNYLYAYKTMTKFFLQGVGGSNDTIFDFAVQFLTDAKLVQKYTREATKGEDAQAHRHDNTAIIPYRRRPELIKVLLEALLAILYVAAKRTNDTEGDRLVVGSLDADLMAISNQKYKHCLDNLEYVLNIGAISNELICDEMNLRLWLLSLRILQNGDAERRRSPHEAHVEYESDTWLSMFNLGIRMHSIFPVAWSRLTADALKACGKSLREIMRVIIEILLSTCGEVHARLARMRISPVYHLISAKQVTDPPLQFITHDFDFSVSKVSMHVPLHRLLACAIRRIAIHQSTFRDQLEQDTLLVTLGLDTLTEDERIEIVEDPLRCLAMASQIQSNLWRRNGDENMMAQLYNYSALPYCVHYRDADVFIMQLGVLLLGAENIVARILDRFELGAYLASHHQDTPHGQDEARKCSLEHGYHNLDAEFADPHRYLQLLEEFLRLLIVIGTTLPAATGTEYEQSFLKEEMLHRLCAKPHTFSRLFEIAILPSGHDDIPAPRLEKVLDEVADFIPPTGLVPGKYALKQGLLEQYNPYFLHLNRESHEKARDRWMTYRKKTRCNNDNAKTLFSPLHPPPRPLSYLQPVQEILMCRSTIAIVCKVMERALQFSGKKANEGDGFNRVSDAVISTALHLLVYGIYAATYCACETEEAPFFEYLRMDGINMGLSLLGVLTRLSYSNTLLRDTDQADTVEWILWKVAECSHECKLHIELHNQKNVPIEETAISAIIKIETASTLIDSDTFQSRKEAARRRALEAMSKQQASFSVLMTEMMEEVEASDENGKGSDDQSYEETSFPRKRKQNSGTSPEQEVKRQRMCQAKPTCILCHDSSRQAEMGVAALVHQSTVFSTIFRPHPDNALGSEGAETREQIKELIDSMGLCSGGENLLNHGMASDLGPQDLPTYESPFGDWIRNAVPDVGFVLDTEGRNEHLNIFQALDTEGRNMNRLALLGDSASDSHNVNVAEDDGDQDIPSRPTSESVTIQRTTDQTTIRSQEGPVEGSGDRDITPPLRRLTTKTAAKLYLKPCGLHIRSCQHAVHRSCLDGYIHTIHEKAARGEEFDGVQAIDPDSAMMQFLCPLCKTISNILIPITNFYANVEDNQITNIRKPRNTKLHTHHTIEEKLRLQWFNIVQEQANFSCWYRAVPGRDGSSKPYSGPSSTDHEQWRDYFEQTLWEPHGSLEKGAPYLWSACAYSIASFIRALPEEAQGTFEDQWDSSLHEYPSSVQKELSSLTTITKFCRWSFSLLEHCEDAKVIWETAKRCSPLHLDTKREQSKFKKLIDSIDPCLRGTIWGLLVADTFTAFVVASVIALNQDKIRRSIPVFAVADLLNRLHSDFFVQVSSNLELFACEKVYTSSSKADKSRLHQQAAALLQRPCTRRRNKLKLSALEVVAEESESAAAMIRKELDKKPCGNIHAVLQLMLQFAIAHPGSVLKSSKLDQLPSRIDNILEANNLLIRRMKLFWRCLFSDSQWDALMDKDITVPEVINLDSTPRNVLDQLWQWNIERKNNQQHIRFASKGDICEHTEGCSDSYTASMFIIRDIAKTPQLVKLPIQYDRMYSQYMGQACGCCHKVPIEAGICLVCGQFLCCGDSCCTSPYVLDGPPVGECTRHAAECGGGVGIILLLDQCRVAILAGSMAAYFPGPYVDAYGEEDIGLQRGRPLRLDAARYRHLEELWINHRVFAEVSRQRNACDPQYAINLSYL